MGDDRVEDHRGDLGHVVGEHREPADEFGERPAADGRGPLVAAEQWRGLDGVDQFGDVDVVERRDAVADVLEQVPRGPGDGEGDHGPEQGVLGAGDDGRDARVGHALHGELATVVCREPGIEGFERLPHRGRAAEVDPHTLKGGLAAHDRRERLDHDGIAQRLGGRDGFPGRGDDGARPQVDAVGREEFLRLLVAQMQAFGVLRKMRVDDVLRLAALDSAAGERHTLVLAAPLAIAGGLGEGADGVLGRHIERQLPVGSGVVGGLRDRLGGGVPRHQATRADHRRDHGLVGVRRQVVDHGDGFVLAAAQRRGEAHDDGVDLVIGEGLADLLGELIERRLGIDARRSVGDLQALALGDLGGQGRQLHRVADDGHPPALGLWLVDEDLGHVEHLVDVVDMDDARLREHRGERHRVDLAHAGPMPWRHTEFGRARLDDDDRFGHRQPAPDAGELAGVTHRFQIEADGAGAIVVHPVLHEVVAGDVEPVAGGGERGDAEGAAPGGLEDGDAERAALREQPEVARRGHGGRQRRVHRHRFGRIDQTERGRSDDAHAAVAGQPQQATFEFLAVLAGLGETSRDDHQPMDIRARAVFDDRYRLIGGHGDHGHVDVRRDRADGGVGRDPEDLVGAGIDGIQLAGEPAVAQVPQHFVADRPLGAAGPDDGDHLGRQQRRDADRLGAVLPRQAHRLRLLGRLDVEVDLHDAVLDAAGDDIAGVGEHREHLVVLRQDLGLETGQPVVTPDVGEVLQQH